MISNKIEKIIKEKGMTQKAFANFIGMNHEVFNRNLKNNNMTNDMLRGFIENLKDVDFNWLFKNEDNTIDILNEPSEIYGNTKTHKIDEAIKILEDIKKDLSQL